MPTPPNIFYMARALTHTQQANMNATFQSKQNKKLMKVMPQPTNQGGKGTAVK